MYGITKSKMINPFHITSIDYIVNEITDNDGLQTGTVFIQMTNQPDGKAYKIESTCDNCERVINDLIAIVKKINRDEDKPDVPRKDFTIIPGGNIDFN